MWEVGACILSGFIGRFSKTLKNTLDFTITWVGVSFVFFKNIISTFQFIPGSIAQKVKGTRSQNFVLQMAIQKHMRF